MFDRRMLERVLGRRRYEAIEGLKLYGEEKHNFCSSKFDQIKEYKLGRACSTRRKLIH
jgi:hypothetical protein